MGFIIALLPLERGEGGGGLTALVLSFASCGRCVRDAAWFGSWSIQLGWSERYLRQFERLLSPEVIDGRQLCQTLFDADYGWLSNGS